MPEFRYSGRTRPGRPRGAAPSAGFRPHQRPARFRARMARDPVHRIRAGDAGRPERSPSMSIARILHPSDFSRACGAAFAKAIDLAKTNRAELIVFHAFTSVIPMVGDGYVSPKVFEEVENSARAEAKKQLDRLVAKAKKAGARARGLLAQGAPQEQILRAARSTRAD